MSLHESLVVPTVGQNLHEQPSQTVLGTDELRRMTSAVEAGTRITPAAARAFATAELNPDPAKSRKLDWIIASLLGGAYVGAETTVIEYGDQIPDIANMPRFAATALDVIYRTVALGNDTAVNSTAYSHHLPRAILASSIGTAAYGAKRVYDQVKKRRILKDAQGAQLQLRAAMDGGTVNWNMPKGYTAAFVGGGEPLADLLLSEESVDELQLAYSAPSKGEWTYLPREATYSETMEAFDRANFEKAGPLVFLPITPTHEFLPGDADYDIPIGRMVFYINAANKYCKDHNIPKKPVLIISSRKQSDTFITDYPGDPQTKNWDIVKRLGLLENSGGSEIKIIDPNDIVMDSIMAIAKGRRPVLAGTQESVERYGGTFRRVFDGFPRDFDEDNPVKVFYNRTDIPTANAMTKDDIAVIIDPNMVELLEYRGIPRERIIVVPKVIAAKVAPRPHRLQQLALQAA